MVAPVGGRMLALNNRCRIDTASSGIQMCQFGCFNASHAWLCAMSVGCGYI